jgi:Zn-dependent protease with chaperone function/tetratricopeptide (TPR) repeat protein
MTSLLLALLLAQPEPDRQARLEQRFGTQLAEALRLGETDSAGAVRLLDAILDDPEGREMEGRSRSLRVLREQALYYRASLRLQQGDAQAVADDMTALLDSKNTTLLVRSAGLVAALAPIPNGPLGTVIHFHLSPPERSDRFQALSLRAAAYEALGQHDKAKADRAETEEIIQEMTRGLPTSDLARRRRWAWDSPLGLAGWATSPVLVTAVFVGTLPLFFLWGLRQRREACGSWRRLFWVALALACLQTLPVLTAFLLLQWRPWLSYNAAMPFVMLQAVVLHFAWHLAFLKPVRWQRSRQAPPALEDPVVLERIAGLAKQLGVPPPFTRLARSPLSLQLNHAQVSGLAAPTVLLYDGILYRLTAEERDVIIAHELAHLANHTFWIRLLAGALCAVATVAAAAFYSSFVPIALGVALLIGLFTILSRRLELDCDRRAARAIGHRRAASALFKIHADQPFQGVTGFLVGAVASHPSRDERLAAIHRDAPADDRPPAEWDARLLLRRRLAAWLAAGLWLSVILACLEWGRRWPGSIWPALPMLLMALAPLMLFWLALRKARRRRRQLQRTSPSWRKRLAWLVLVLFVGFIAADLAGLTRPYMGPSTSLSILVVGLLATLSVGRLLSRNRADKLNHKIMIAIQSGDFPAALALCEDSPAVVARSTVLRYNHAVIRAVLGRREEALIDLEKLRHDDPRFKMTWHVLATIYADEGEYARALNLAEELSRDLPGEPTCVAAEAWLLRRLGRLEEAHARAREAQKLDERCGLAHLTLAAVAFDRGDAATAREELARAERLVPGSTGAAMLTAEMALAVGGEDAKAAVRQAVRAAQSNPLSFCDKAASRLAARLEALHPTPPA